MQIQATVRHHFTPRKMTASVGVTVERLERSWLWTVTSSLETISQNFKLNIATAGFCKATSSGTQ